MSRSSVANNYKNVLSQKGIFVIVTIHNVKIILCYIVYTHSHTNMHTPYHPSIWTHCYK